MKENKVYFRIIIAISVVIPTVVAILLYSPLDLGLSGSWVKSLPSVNAILNSLTALLLVIAVFAIKNGKVQLHRNLMMTCLTLGTLFLVSYVLYHSNSTSVIFGDMNHDGVLDTDESGAVGFMRTLYVVILLSHIGLSFVVVPFVLLSFYYALSGQIDRHKKMVKFTFPVWLYVSVTGVIVYFMISPYYL